MAQGKKIMGLVLVLVVMVMFCERASAQSSSCTNVLVNLSPCLNYITGNSSTPSSGCCSQLGSTVRSQPQCLCQVLNGEASSSLGININKTQALALPAACNLKTPSITQCSSSNAASPANSAAESPNSDPSGTGSSTGNSMKLSIPLLFIVLAATSLYAASTFTNILILF